MGPTRSHIAGRVTTASGPGLIKRANADSSGERGGNKQAAADKVCQTEDCRHGVPKPPETHAVGTPHVGLLRLASFDPLISVGAGRHEVCHPKRSAVVRAMPNDTPVDGFRSLGGPEQPPTLPHTAPDPRCTWKGVGGVCPSPRVRKRPHMGRGGSLT